MGGFSSMQFPALDIKQPESPIQQLGGVLALKNQVQQGQMGEIQLQQARQNQQSQQTLMRLYAQNNGDLDKTYSDAASSGQVTPEHLMAFKNQIITAKTQLATLQEKDLANLGKMHDLAFNEIESFKALPIEQRTPDVLKAAAGRLNAGGVDISKVMPQLQSLASDPSDANIKNVELGLNTEKWLKTQEDQQRLGSMPTVAQAQQKNAAELDKAMNESAASHISLLSMPTPEEAKTARAATLLKTQAETAASQAATAKSRAETALIGTNPVIAFDPQTQQRVLTTMPQAQAKGFTNPIKASETDIQKETDATKQFNDVQMNISRFRNAIVKLGSPADTHTTEIAHILSEGKFDAGHLASLLPGASLSAEIVNQKQIAADWNNLTEAEQDAVTGYLRAKGSVIAFQKALTQSGRTSKEALAIEMQNLPSPLEASGPALKQMDAFQENIDTASKGLTRVPWLPSPSDVRSTIENEEASKSAQGQAAAQHFRDYQAAQTGQYRNEKGLEMKLGQEAYANGRYIGTVSKLYPNGTYDVKQD